MSLIKIKARLGAVAKSKIEEMPWAVQKLLTDDMPKLIRFAEDALDAVNVGDVTGELRSAALALVGE